jgi:hypothetical protein
MGSSIVSRRCSKPTRTKDLYTERQIERYWDEKMVAGPKRMDSGSGYPIGRVPAAGAGAAPAEVIARLNVARKIIDSRERNPSIPEKAEGDEQPQKEDPWLERVRVSARKRDEKPGVRRTPTTDNYRRFL